MMMNAAIGTLLLVLVAWCFTCAVLPLVALVMALILCFTMPLLGIPLLGVFLLVRVIRG